MSKQTARRRALNRQRAGIRLRRSDLRELREIERAAGLAPSYPVGGKPVGDARTPRYFRAGLTLEQTPAQDAFTSVVCGWRGVTKA